MYSSDREPQNSASRKSRPVCPKCSFENHSAAIYCEICFYPLDSNLSVSDSVDIFSKRSRTTNAKQDSSVTEKPGFYPFTAKSNETALDFLLRQEPNSTATAQSKSWQSELSKPDALSGLVVLALSIFLWINYFVERQAKYLFSNSEDRIVLYDSMNQVKNVPSGLFSYGGALYFASLVAHGINDAMMQSHPNFDLRYTKPIDEDRGYSKGIEMLLNGELSFAFNGRPLKDREYAQAQLRDFKLLQVPIALDGVALFGNKQNLVTDLSLAQVKEIFSGQITNWQELGGADLPIVPVLLTPGDLEVLDFKDTTEIPQLTQYVTNHTLAIRKTIATPGAISFASASLIQEQQAIAVFNLSAGDSLNYVTPIVGGQPNLELFRNGVYPLTRRLFLVIRQDGTPDSLAGKAYAQMLLSTRGQEIVRQSGFVPLYYKQ